MPIKNGVLLKDQKQYSAFKKQKNKALEILLNNSTNKLNKHFNTFLYLTKQKVSYLLNSKPHTVMIMSSVERLRNELHHIALQLSAPMVSEVIRCKRISYTLSKAGEVQSLVAATTKKHIANVTKHSWNNEEEQRRNHELSIRAQMYLTRIIDKVCDRTRIALLQKKTPAEAMRFVIQALPIPYFVKIPRRTLKEAFKIPDAMIIDGDEDEGSTSLKLDFDGGKSSLTEGVIDQDMWDEMLEAYKEGLSPLRFDDLPEDMISTRGVVKYGWQLENDLTHDFVDEVRAGENEAAKENGVSDFIWVAVLDDKTDECCQWRNGLTTKEIEAKLGSEHADDDCEEITPPAHYNCRCDLSPYLDEMPEPVESNAGDFDKWLNS